MRKLSAENRYAVYASLLLICVIIPALPYIKGRLGLVPLAVSLYWCVLTGIIFFILPRLYIIHKGDKDLTGYGISGGIIFIAIQFVPAVFMKKLASSPYDISVLGILFNMITLLPQIAAREMIRQYSFAAAYKTCKYKSNCYYNGYILFDRNKLWRFNGCKEYQRYFYIQCTDDISDNNKECFGIFTCILRRSITGFNIFEHNTDFSEVFSGVA